MKKRMICMLMAVIMMLGLLPATAFAADDTEDFAVVVSIEGLTLGQGIYVKPTAYTLDEINDLIATEGYGPYTEANLTAGMATLAFLIDNNLEYEMTGTWDKDAYLSSVKDLDTGVVNVPQVILDNGGSADDGNGDDYLGEFDYNMQSGWMITVNDYMIDVGCAAWGLEENQTRGIDGYDLGNTYVVRWQFTLSGYGADLGVDTGWGNSAYFDGAKKAPLYAAYAKSADAAKKAAALPVMENLTATQTEVDTALATLTAADPAPETPKDYKTILNDTMAQLAATVTAPAFGTTAGEWTVLALARGNYYPAGSSYFEDYYTRIAATVQETAASVNLSGALHKVKSTENSRLILALSAIGKDPTNVGGVDILGAYSANGFTWIKKQGINGPVFALIALDTQNYVTEDDTIRQQCIDYILEKELAGGGWALSGTTADPDMTAMTLQALAPYKNNPEVAAAAERGFTTLSSIQQDNGGYASWGTVNSESIAQVIVACTAWGINPNTDSRFVKNGRSAVDAILDFYVTDGKGFAHTEDDTGTLTVNAMATDQACYALVAYDRYLNNQNSLYDMTDVEMEQADKTDEMTATLGLPAEVEEGAAFNATVSINKWDNEAGYKLIDFIVTIPDGVNVTGVTAGSRLSGGEVSYNLETETGKLRVVYFDANENSDITVTGSEFPAELFTIGFTAASTGSMDIAISGMSVKLSSDSSDEAAMIIVNTDRAKGTVSVVKGLSFSAVCLYEGDDVDLIPSTKKAVAVAVTGIANSSKLTYHDGTHEIVFRYSAEITAKTGIATYVALVDASIDMASFANQTYYTIAGADAPAITFGDSNGDGVINAQDALAAVDAWLRKGEEVTDDDILILNVNGDSRINTFDALGIVEKFVNGGDYGVVSKAASITTQQ